MDPKQMLRDLVLAREKANSDQTEPRFRVTPTPPRAAKQASDRGAVSGAYLGRGGGVWAWVWAWACLRMCGAAR